MKTQFGDHFINDEDIQNELKEIIRKLDRIRKLNDDIRFLLIIIVIGMIYFAFIFLVPLAFHA